jgi:hypothetical protein
VPGPGQLTTVRIDAHQWVQNILEQWQLAAAVALVVALPDSWPPPATVPGMGSPG